MKRLPHVCVMMLVTKSYPVKGEPTNANIAQEGHGCPRSGQFVMLIHDIPSWATGKEPSWLGTSPAKWPVRGSLVAPMLASPCRAGLTASAWLWRCLGGQAHLVSPKCVCNSQPDIDSKLPLHFCSHDWSPQATFIKKCLQRCSK